MGRSEVLPMNIITQSTQNYSQRGSRVALSSDAEMPRMGRRNSDLLQRCKSYRIVVRKIKEDCWPSRSRIPLLEHNSRMEPKFCHVLGRDVADSRLDFRQTQQVPSLRKNSHQPVPLILQDIRLNHQVTTLNKGSCCFSSHGQFRKLS